MTNDQCIDKKNEEITPPCFTPLDIDSEWILKTAH